MDINASVEYVLTTFNLTSNDNIETSHKLYDFSIDDVIHKSAFHVIIVGRYVHILWYILGFIGNIVSAVIWNSDHMYDVCTTAHYLVTLSCCDVLCQCLHVFYYLKVYWHVRSLDSPVLCELWSILYMIPLYISELLVLGFTAEKLVSIRNPFRTGWFNRHQRAPKEIVWIVVSMTVLAFPQAYFWKVDNRGYCEHNRRTKHWEYGIWHWVVDSLIYIVTPFTVVVLNCFIVQEAKLAALTTVARRRDVGPLRQSTLVLLRLSYLRVFTLLPSTVMYFLESMHIFSPAFLPEVTSSSDVYENEAWKRYTLFTVIKLYADVISSSRNAVSIILFTYTSTHFHRELDTMITQLKEKCVKCARKTVARVTHNLRAFEDDDIQNRN